MSKKLNLLKKGSAYIAAAAAFGLMFVNAFAYGEYDDYDEEALYYDEYDYDSDYNEGDYYDLYYNEEEYYNYDISVMINDEEVFFESAEPYFYLDYCIPLRETFEKLGYVVEWDSNSKSVTITKGDYTAQYYPESWNLYINGEETDEWVDSENKDGTLMIYDYSLDNIDKHLICEGDDNVLRIYTLTDSELQAIADIEEQVYELEDKYSDRLSKFEERLMDALNNFSDIDLSECEDDEDVVAAILSVVKGGNTSEYVELLKETRQLFDDIYSDMKDIYAKAPRGYDEFDDFCDEYTELKEILNTAIDFLEGKTDVNDVLETYRELMKKYEY